MTLISLRPIGIIRSPHKTPETAPVQPIYAAGALGEVIIDDQYERGLVDLDGFDRLWLIYWCHRARRYQPIVIPNHDDQARGLFSTRSTGRPNPIGISAVRLLGRQGGRLQVADVDILDRTPLLDIKPYVPLFDSYPLASSGWLEQRPSFLRQTGDGFQRTA